MKFRKIAAGVLSLTLLLTEAEFSLLRREEKTVGILSG